MTKRVPENYKEKDLDNYHEIVERSSTHRRDNNPNNSLKTSSRYKYQGIIKNLFQKNESPAFNMNAPSLADELAQAATGKGLRKIAHNYLVEYIYYHSPKQLRHRYKVLFGEIQAGNNNPVKINDLVNIRKELDGTGRGFFNNILDKLPIELHVPGFEYLGPGTNYNLKQEKGIKPADKLDEFAMNRDKFYSENKNLKKRLEADYVLQRQARKRITAPDASLGEKLAAVDHLLR